MYHLITPAATRVLVTAMCEVVRKAEMVSYQRILMVWRMAVIKYLLNSHYVLLHCGRGRENITFKRLVISLKASRINSLRLDGRPRMLSICSITVGT